MSFQTVQRYARHAERFGDPRTVYETSAAELTLDELLALGRRLVKVDPGEYREGRRAVKFERFTWRWAYGLHVRIERLRLCQRGPVDCLRATEWELSVLFENNPSAAVAPPGSIFPRIAEIASGRTGRTGASKPKSRPRPPVPGLGERFGRLVVERMVKRADGRTWLLCNCDCGGSTLAKPSHLRRGEIVSCGCKRREDSVGKLRLVGGEREEVSAG